MVFSIIIPTCNRYELLSQCLNLLKISLHSFEQSEYEVIVSDDSNNSDTKILISTNYNWVKWIEGSKRGPAANRNNGAAFAKGEWLIFLDDDCLPDGQLVSEYIKAIAVNKNNLVFEGCIKADKSQESFIDESPINETGGYLWSCNFMINEKLFNNIINRFDEHFPFAAMEDVDLHYRLRKEKYNILFVRSAFVIHPWRQQKNMFRITMQRFKSTLYFMRKHPETESDINAKYYFKLFLLDIKQLFFKAAKYRFRGVKGKLIHSGLHLYFCFYFLLKLKEQK